MRIRTELVEKMKGDNALLAKIQLATNAASSTIYRWIQFNSVMLTTKDVMHVIQDHFQISQDDLFCDPIKKIEMEDKNQSADISSNINFPGK